MTTPNESKTPRTDAAEIEVQIGSDSVGRPAQALAVPSSFARQLETELTTLQNDVRRLVGKIQENVNRFEKVQWGYDGDCGSGEPISYIQEAIDDLTTNNPSLKPE